MGAFVGKYVRIKTPWVIAGNNPYGDRISPYQNELLAYGQILLND